MTTRILPPEEWARIAHTDLGPVVMAVNPDAVTVVVAEDEQGAIAGCWALINFAHLEGMWVDPAHRRKGVVLKRMWNTICDVAAERGLGSVLTGSVDPSVTAWIEHRGGEKLPFESFVLPLVPLGRMH